MNFLKILGLKKSYFVNGLANFDQISYSQISDSLSLGSYIDGSDINSQLSIDALQEYKELMVYGTISDNGLIVISGMTGFPFDSKCVEYCREISKNAEISKIQHHSIHIKW